jgi:hypothetical protein
MQSVLQDTWSCSAFAKYHTMCALLPIKKITSDSVVSSFNISNQEIACVARGASKWDSYSDFTKMLLVRGR